MPIPTPFHDRTAPLCRSFRWKDWAGYCAVCSYEASHEPEYYAIRHATALFDVSPLHKYDLSGPGAGALLAYVTVRDVRKMRVGRVLYLCWCDDDGKVIDDGTVTRLDEDHYRLTAAEPTGGWLARHARRFDVEIQDRSHDLAALALQGPTSRAVLSDAADAELGSLGFFEATSGQIDGQPVWISRTGYTGDLGYEVWVQRDGALAVWDSLLAAGRPHGLVPAGLDALDVARIEAGYVMLDVDYYGARTVVLESRKSTPFEIGLGWTVKTGRSPFLGQQALAAAADRPPTTRLVGLEASWEALEALYDRYGLPPSLPARASREPLPVYGEGAQVGRISSHTWSPMLKKSIALASVRAESAVPGTVLELEHTVEYERRTVPATVVELPFFDPDRKRS